MKFKQNPWAWFCLIYGIIPVRIKILAFWGIALFVISGQLGFAQPNPEKKSQTKTLSGEAIDALLENLIKPRAKRFKEDFKGSDTIRFSNSPSPLSDTIRFSNSPSPLNILGLSGQALIDFFNSLSPSDQAAVLDQLTTSQAITLAPWLTNANAE